jgi:hypothetical protein
VVSRCPNCAPHAFRQRSRSRLGGLPVIGVPSAFRTALLVAIGFVLVGLIAATADILRNRRTGRHPH